MSRIFVIALTLVCFACGKVKDPAKDFKRDNYRGVNNIETAETKALLTNSYCQFVENDNQYLKFNFAQEEVSISSGVYSGSWPNVALGRVQKKTKAFFHYQNDAIDIGNDAGVNLRFLIRDFKEVYVNGVARTEFELLYNGDIVYWYSCL